LVNISYLRKNKLTLFALSAAVVLLSAIPLILFNLLQPVQAQTSMTFRTTKPAITEDPNTGQEFTLTFDAKGTTSSSDPQSGSISDGTFQIASRQDGTILTSGNIRHGGFSNSSNGVSITMDSTVLVGQDSYQYVISTACSTSEENEIDVMIMGGPHSEYTGPVECSTQGGGGGDTTTQQTSSSTTGTTTQDGDSDRDGDGIPNANDNCPNLPHTRCYKEGDTTVAVHNNSNR
jgi:hypothetical protein